MKYLAVVIFAFVAVAIAAPTLQENTEIDWFENRGDHDEKNDDLMSYNLFKKQQEVPPGMGVSFFKRKNSFPDRMNQIKRQVSLFKKEADQLAFFKKEAPTPGFALFKKEAPTPGFALFKKEAPTPGFALFKKQDFALFKKQGIPLFKKQAPTSGFALFKKQGIPLFKKQAGISFFKNEDAYNKKADKLTNPKEVCQFEKYKEISPALLIKCCKKYSYVLTSESLAICARLIW